MTLWTFTTTGKTAIDIFKKSFENLLTNTFMCGILPII